MNWFGFLGNDIFLNIGYCFICMKDVMGLQKRERSVSCRVVDCGYEFFYENKNMKGGMK